MPTGVPNADHWMVSTTLNNDAAPKTGKGRWSISPKIYKDTTFKKTARKAGREAIRKLNEYSQEWRTAENNP